MQSAPQSSAIWLKDITAVERTELKQYCLLVESKDRKIWLSLKSDEELYGWQDDIYSRSPLMGVSNPTNFVHKIHVGFDPVSGAFTVSISRAECLPKPLRLRLELDTDFRVFQNNGLDCSHPPPSLEKITPKIHKLS